MVIIKKEYVYTSQEVADYFNLHIKKVTRLAKKQNIKKVGKGYEFSGEFLIKYFKMDDTDIVPEVSVKKTFQEHLKSQPFKNNNKVIEENKVLKLEIELLKAKLSEFDLKDNERIEIFTQTQYSEFEKRLKKYPEQKKVIEENKKIQLELSTKLEIKDVKIEHANESLKYYKESIDFWKSQAEYKDKQSEKFLEMHSKLIESVSNYSKASFIEATVKAKNTEWSTKKPK